MTEDNVPSMPDNEFDGRIARYLRWESGQLRGSPERQEIAMRIAAGPVQRPWAGNPALAWAALLITLLIVAVAILVAGNRDDDLVVVAPTPSPLGSQVLGPCGAGRVQIQPVSGGEISADAAAIQAPAGGQIALALEEGPAGGSIVVAGEGIDTHLVGTFTGEIESTGQVQVLEWSPTGDELLVWAGAEHLHEGDRNCGDLWVLAADGSSLLALTSNPPGQVASLGTYAPSGDMVAYLQDDAVHVVSPGEDARSVAYGGCGLNGAHALRWSLDGTRILLVCDEEIVVVDLNGATAKHIRPSALVLDARWAADGSSIVAAAVEIDPGLTGEALWILDVDPVTGTFRTTAEGDRVAEWVLGGTLLSPDGRWLLVQGELVDGPPPYYPTDVIDTATGVTSRPGFGILTETGFLGREDMYTRRPGAIWLEDNDRVLMAQDGTIYEVDLTSLERRPVGSVPAHDFAWYPFSR